MRAATGSPCSCTRMARTSRYVDGVTPFGSGRPLIAAFSDMRCHLFAQDDESAKPGASLQWPEGTIWSRYAARSARMPWVGVRPAVYVGCPKQELFEREHEKPESLGG